MFTVTAPMMVNAQCTLTGNIWTCSGNVGTTSITGTDPFFNKYEFVSGVTGIITVIAGDHHDELDFSTFLTSINLNLTTNSPQTLAAGLTLILNGFNTNGQTYGVISGAGNDILTGGLGNDVFYSGAGDDTVNGGANSDTIFAGSGNNTVYGGDGGDRVISEDGNDVIDTGSGDDTVYSGAGDDVITGGAGIDDLYAEAGDDIVSGGPDNDKIYGGDGADVSLDTLFSDCSIDIIESDLETNQCSGSAPVEESISQPLNGDLCITAATRVALVDGTLLVFSDFTNTNNGMTISHISLSSLRAPTDEEKASGLPIGLGYKDSEFAPGWGVAVYWQTSHYGFVIYQDNGQTVYDDTGAICGWF